MIKPLAQAQSSHSVEVLIAKGDFKKGDRHAIQILPMTGKVFKPGKTEDGKKWLDTIGKPDTRMMVFTNNLYQVFDSMDEVHKTFQEG